jgi:hypothetical protein
MNHSIVTCCGRSYLAARCTRLRVGVAAAARVLAVMLIRVSGRVQSGGFLAEWRDSAKVTASSRFLTQSDPGSYLAESYNIPLAVLRVAHSLPELLNGSLVLRHSAR